MTLRPARRDDMQRILQLLTDAELPTSDLGADFQQTFVVAEEGERILGCVGSERYGSVALLRSLVVSPGARGQGLGRQLVRELQANVTRNVEQLWLLTIDQKAFFERHGFIVADRDSAPEPIATSEEFTSLCPGSAILMCKPLRRA